MNNPIKRLTAVLLTTALMIGACIAGVSSSVSAEEYTTYTLKGHRYAVIEKEMKPLEAEEYCKSLGGHLATVTSQEEQEFIAGIAAKVDYRDFWIGGSDEGAEGVWYWLNGEPWDYTAWYPGGSVGDKEPNNGLGTGENYVCMDKARDYLWVDCFGAFDGYSTTCYFICEWDDTNTKKELNGHSYQLFELGMTWEEAKKYCESLGGHLATITSQEEQDFVKGIVGEGTKKNYWLGGYKADNGEYAWITDEEFSFVGWTEGSPDNNQGLENRIMMWHYGGWNDVREDGKWLDSPDYGTANFGFICEWDDTSSQTVKGDVNSDGKFDIADIVLMQKWLLAIPDTELKNWKAGDFYNDSRLDIFDLCLMRKALISQS